jgi:hypothetical protein
MTIGAAPVAERATVVSSSGNAGEFESSTTTASLRGAVPAKRLDAAEVYGPQPTGNKGSREAPQTGRG